MSLCQKHPDCVANDQVTHVCPLLDRVTKPAPPEVSAPDEVWLTWLTVAKNRKPVQLIYMTASDAEEAQRRFGPGIDVVRYVRAREGER